jgi:hypothetical protein
VSIATGLDHAGVAVHDLDTAAAEWQALGFQVTPTAPHLPGGITGNRCVMFREGYVELIAMLAGHSATLARFLARYQGIHIISLATADADGAGQRLGQPIIRSERETDAGTARFARIVLAEIVPRVQLIRHLTPELVWQPAQTRHPNGASALVGIVLRAERPAEAAASLSRAAGVPVVPDPEGGYALRLAHGQVRVLPDGPPEPYVTGIELRSDDPTALGRTLSATGVDIRFVA